MTLSLLRVNYYFVTYSGTYCVLLRLCWKPQYVDHNISFANLSLL